MDDQDWLAERFELNRSHLRGVAFRMLGSLTVRGGRIVAIDVLADPDRLSRLDLGLVAR